MEKSVPHLGKDKGKDNPLPIKEGAGQKKGGDFPQGRCIRRNRQREGGWVVGGVGAWFVIKKAGTMLTASLAWTQDQTREDGWATGLDQMKRCPKGTQ